MPLTNIDVSTIATVALGDARERNFNPSIIATKFDGYKKEGDTIKVDVLAESAGAAAYDAATNNYEKDRSLTEALKSVTLGTPILDGFSLRPTDFKALTKEGLKKRMQRHVSALVKKMMTDTMSIVNNENYGAALIIGEGSAMDTTVVTDIKTNAKFLKFGTETDPNALISMSHYENLMEQPSTLQALQRGSTEVNVGGFLTKPYRGISWTGSNIIPANAENLVGLVTDGSGIALGIGVSDDYDSLDEMFGAKQYHTDVITDTESGLAFRLTVGFNRGTKRIDVVMDMVYGYAVGQASKLLRLVSA